MPDSLPESRTIPDKPWVAVVANPYSGALSNRERVAALVAAIESHGLACRVIWDRAERNALLNDTKLADRCRCVVAAGGDGTVSDVINELASPAVPIAVLPLGTENLFAKQFGYDRGPVALAAAIHAGRSRAIDLGEITAGRPGESDPRIGRRFSLMFSMGADAEVMRRLDAWRCAHPHHLRRVRRWTYAPHILATLCRYSYPPIEVHVDGQIIPGTHSFFFNLPRYGIGLTFAPDARDDDGLLDYVIFQRPGSFTALRYVWSVIFGGHTKRPDVVHGRAREIRIHSDKPVPIQMDGEAVGFTPVGITVRPAALRVIVA